MVYDQNTVHTLYKKLLTLYPRGFREQLGESMEQTFNDLYNERKRRKEQGLFGFVLWTFIETAIGVAREHILLLAQGDPMNILTNLRTPTLISFLVVLPFMILEWVNRRNFNEGFPIPLFVILWLLPTVFIVTLMPLVQNIRAGNSLMANPLFLLLRVVFLLGIVWFWGSIMIDQMPCFLGAPNCD
jgi:hypothetical protein